MITNLKDMKARLSAYVELAASGEDVVITVRGKPKVRLSRMEDRLAPHEISSWGHRLEEARSLYKGDGVIHLSSEQAQWDKLREDRL